MLLTRVYNDPQVEGAPGGSGGEAGPSGSGGGDGGGSKGKKAKQQKPAGVSYCTLLVHLCMYNEAVLVFFCACACVCVLSVCILMVLCCLSRRASAFE